MPSLNPLTQLRDWLEDRQKLARVVDVEQLPPSPDGRQYRYEVSVKLADSVESCPSEDHMREIGDMVLESIGEIDHPDWQGVDELHIQVYSPNREIGTGACGTAHWGGGEYESVDARPYMF